MPPNDLSDLLSVHRRSRSRRRRSSWASRPICCAADRTSGAPSCRRSRSRPRSEWPRPISSPPSP
jgi:hypothetical protein